MTPLLVIVTGAPGAGKTTLGRRLAADLGFPFINKDDVKDVMFTHLGWSDRAWSRKVGKAALHILFHVTEQQLVAGCSLVVECNFRPHLDNQRFRDLQDRYSHRQVQVFCHAPSHVLLERFKARSLHGVRHPGHVEDANWDEIKEALLAEDNWMLDLSGPLMEVDTSDVALIDYGAILGRLCTLR